VGNRCFCIRLIRSWRQTGPFDELDVPPKSEVPEPLIRLRLRRGFAHPRHHLVQ